MVDGEQQVNLYSISTKRIDRLTAITHRLYRLRNRVSESIQSMHYCTACLKCNSDITEEVYREFTDQL